MNMDTSAEEMATEARLTEQQGKAGVFSFLAFIGAGACLWQAHLGWWGIAAAWLLTVSCSFTAQFHTLSGCKGIFRMLYALGRLIQE